MARNQKTRSKRSLKQRKSCIATLEKVNSLRRPLGEHTNTVGAQSPTKIIHNLKVENENLKKKVKQSTQTGDDNLYESDNDDV